VISDPADLIRVVADPLRLSILGRAAEGRVSLDELSESFGVPKKKVVEAIGKLRALGLVDNELRLVPDVLRSVAAELPTAAEAAATIVEGPWSGDERDILRRFFSGTRLVEIPTSRAKRLLVLERLAQEFEPGLRYEESAVSFTLQLFHRDYAALRRYLVDEGFLTRADGVYWRTGGRFASREMANGGFDTRQPGGGRATGH
jgi:DNA-binding transcriptional ArsR family regulator